MDISKFHLPLKHLTPALSELPQEAVSVYVQSKTKFSLPTQSTENIKVDSKPSPNNSTAESKGRAWGGVRCFVYSLTKN